MATSISRWSRSIAADLVGRPDEWNYREVPGTSDVIATLQRFQDNHIAAE